MLQPDPSRTGGITAIKKIAAMADAHYVLIAPHNPNGPVCTAAGVHVAASIPNFVHHGGRQHESKGLQRPEAPGLGVNFSPQFLKERTVKICASERLGCRLATLS
jgi:galactonate dehydratase